MGCTSLKGGKFDCPCLAADLSSQEVCQIRGCSGKLFVSECIYIISAAGQFTHITSVRKFDSLRYRYDDGFFLFEQIFDLRKECIDIKRCFRQINKIRSFAFFRFGKCGRPCQPSGIPSHYLNDRDHLFFVGESQCITDHFFCGCPDVFGCTSKSRCVVGQCKIVVNGLWHTQKLLLMAFDDRII